jgi:hypothetical protein
MHPSDFESLCCRLIRLEYPSSTNLIRPRAPGDGGADMVLPDTGSSTQRAWQVKHFAGAINWTDCKKSLAKAKETWKPTRYTFCFPRDLTYNEQKTFNAHFRDDAETVDVDFWAEEAITAKLLGSDAGERVARTFFNDPELDLRTLENTMRAGGALGTAPDIFDRLLPVGEQLSRNDAYFSYLVSGHDARTPGHQLPPGTAMSVSRTKNSITTRADAVPLDEEALERYGPAVQIETTPDEKGARAAELIQQALELNMPLSLTEGAELVVEKAPPFFQDFVGQRLTGGTLELRPENPRPIPPYHAHLAVRTAEGPAALDITLRPVQPAPDGFDGALAGSFGGLLVTVRFRQLNGVGSINWSFNYGPSAKPLRERLAALRFMTALRETGELTITDRGPTKRPEIQAGIKPGELPDSIRALAAYFEDLVVISDWSNATLDVPPTIEPRDAAVIAQTAKLIRDRGSEVTWTELTRTVTEEELAKLNAGGLQLALVRSLSANINDQLVELGATHFVATRYVVTVKAENTDGTYDVSITPADNEAASGFEHLSRPPKPRRAPPSASQKGRGAWKRKNRRKC